MRIRPDTRTGVSSAGGLAALVANSLRAIVFLLALIALPADTISQAIDDAVAVEFSEGDGHEYFDGKEFADGVSAAVILSVSLFAPLKSAIVPDRQTVHRRGDKRSPFSARGPPTLSA
jgi:hypothetical protein